jgi:heavy metal sensor kinase
MLRRLSIRTRLTLWHIGLLALTLSAFSVALYAALSDQLYRGLDDRLQLESNSAFDILRREGFGPSDQDRPVGVPTPVVVTPTADFSIRLIDATGQVVNATGLLSVAPIDAALLDQALPLTGAFRTIAFNNNQQVRVYAVPLSRSGQTVGYVEVAESLNVTESTLRDLGLILLIAIPATVGLSAFGGWFIADRALRPIDTITRQAQQISEQDLHRRLNLDLPEDEVGRLARTFDAMLDRLDTAFKRQRQFTADASHELRTPLTVMKTNIGVTLNRPRNVQQYQTALSEVETEIDRLTRLTNDLLLLARSDAHQPIAQLHNLDLAPLVQDVVEELQPLAEANSLTLTSVAPKSAKAHGNSDQLHRVFFNLIENAIKYTKHGGIKVQVTTQPAAIGIPPQVCIAIEDTGSGIAAEHLPHLFERFYRVDSARTREQGGTGLGLAIAHSIITAHGGSIDVESEIGHGTIVTVILPAV